MAITTAGLADVATPAPFLLLWSFLLLLLLLAVTSSWEARLTYVVPGFFKSPSVVDPEKMRWFPRKDLSS
jgi:hypothetical protein